MSKDKPAKKISMKEFIATAAVDEPSNSSIADEQITEDILYSDEQNEKLISYNENIKNLDELYSNLIPRFDVLVRIYVNPMEVSESGVLKPNTVPVSAPTNAGVHYIGSMDNPYPYSSKAIVISVPSEVTDLKPGDIVGLADTPVKGIALGKGDQAVVTIPNKYVHPDEAKKYPIENPLPSDPSDRNYGYLLIKPYDVKVIIQKNN